MALLQNTSSNILFVDNSQEAETVEIMESSDKLLEAREGEDHEKNDPDDLEREECTVDQNEELKGYITSKSDACRIAELTSKTLNEEDSSLSSTNKEMLSEEKCDEMTVELKTEGDEVDQERKIGIYDMPLEVEGKRERHKVDRISIATPVVKKPASSMRMGDGVPLGEIAYIEDQLRKHGPDELKTMHRVLYGHPGKATTVKKEIRKFTGFAFEEDSQEFKKKVAFLHKLSLDQLKTIKNILGLHSGGQSKDAVITTIMVFLMKTVDHARRVAKKRKHITPKTSTTKRSRKRKAVDELPSDEEEDDEKSEQKLTTKTPVKRVISKKAAKTLQPTSGKEVATKVESESDSVVKKKKSNEGFKDSDDDSSSSSSANISHENTPSEKELQNVIEELLSQVDLSQVSMKQMCQAVIEKFPGTNISNRVDYLKGLIKRSLATK